MAKAQLFEYAPTLSATIAHASRSNDQWAEPTLSEGPTIPHPSNNGARLISRTDEDYPDRLRIVEFPPEYLYVIGSLRETSSHAPLAIVGSRSASPKGQRAASDIADALATRGHSIVSGLAMGIDSAAHQGALRSSGHTIAVVGTGVDRVYPPENHKLRNRIAEHGGIVSQFPLGHGPSKTTFPARNAVIAGLSAASLLVEMSERSGTRIEASVAIEQGKPVLLWAPLLADAAWAQDFANHPLVSFVETLDDVTNILDRCEP